VDDVADAVIRCCEAFVVLGYCPKLLETIGLERILEEPPVPA